MYIAVIYIKCGMSLLWLVYTWQEKHEDYQGQIKKLEKKLKWYAENQDLLDKDLQVIKKKDEEIRKLKVQLESLQSEVPLPIVYWCTQKYCSTWICL